MIGRMWGWVVLAHMVATVAAAAVRGYVCNETDKVVQIYMGKKQKNYDAVLPSTLMFL